MNKNGAQLKFDERYQENGEEYELYAVIEHIGRTRKDGHYIAHIKSATGIWHCFDDESVTMTNFERVKKARVYIWIYSKKVKFLNPKKNGDQPDSIQVILESKSNFLKLEREAEEAKKLKEVERREKEAEIQKKREARKEKTAEIMKMKQLKKRHPEQFKKALKEKIKKQKRLNQDYNKPVGQKVDISKLDRFAPQQAVNEKVKAQIQEMIEENAQDLTRQMKIKDAYDLEYDKGKLKKVKDKKKQRKQVKLDFERVTTLGRDKKGNLISKHKKAGGSNNRQKMRHKGKMKRRYGDKFKNKKKQSSS